MIKNHANKSGYSEPFDMERLEEIAYSAMNGKGTTGSSDLECHVHSLMKRLVEHGMDAEYKRETHGAVNELCLLCGKYSLQHMGACDGCKWLEMRSHRVTV